jgi:hypothetical protein
MALMIALLLAAPLLRAESLYKCTDAGGAVSIQSEPCAKGSTQVWKRDAAPEPGPTPEELEARTALAQAEAARAAELARIAELDRLAEQERRDEQARLRAAEAIGERPARKSDCRLAHEFSDAAAAKPWLEFTQTQRERIRSWVIEQCRDPEVPVAAETVVL